MDGTKIRNALLLRIESAKLFKKDVSFKKSTNLEFEINDKKVKYCEQSLDLNYKNEFHTSEMKDDFKSRDGIDTEPRWLTTYEGNHTNGDIWIPLESKENILKVHVVNGKFIGIATITLSTETHETKTFDLFDKAGSKLEGSYIKFGYMFGTQYEIAFHTGDRNFAPGYGNDTQVLGTKLLPGSSELPGIYKLWKNLNLFKTSGRDTEKEDENNVMFQINGSNITSMFFICKAGTHEPFECPVTKRSGVVSKYRFFVHECIGVPLSISLRLVTPTGRVLVWYLEKLNLKRIGDEHCDISLPCFQWITAGRLKTIVIPNSLLPEHLLENNKTVAKKMFLEHQHEIEIARSKYQWSKHDGLPSLLRGTEYGAYDLVSMNEQLDEIKTKDFLYQLNKTLQAASINTKLPSIQLTHIEDYQKLYNLFLSQNSTKPQSADLWNNDEYFGWTFLAGTNPHSIKVCKKVPTQFTTSLLKELINCEDPEEQCEKGRIFVADYTELSKYRLHSEGVPSVPSIQTGTKYCSPCICLLYVGDDNKLRPIAIQLTHDGPIFTPKDNNWQWVYAKIAVHNADSQYHQYIHSWLHTHQVIETFAIALNRSISRSNPVYRLLYPYLKHTIAINVLARKGLTNPGGLLEQLTSMGSKQESFIKDHYKLWDFYKNDLVSKLENQGFSREYKGALLDFPYMDDGLLVWDAIHEYVGNFLKTYYHSEEDLSQDSEIKNWMHELQTNGNPLHRFNEVKTISELQSFLTTLIWATTGQHSVLNYNKYHMYGFIPNYPLALFKPPPSDKNDIDEKFIIESLPGKVHSSIQITLMNLLSTYADNEEYLTSTRYVELDNEPKAVECLKNFQRKLKEIEKTIKKRNEERVLRGLPPYTLLMPSKIPNSI